MIVADLHIHSRYSRATSRELTPEGLWTAAQTKGVDLLGSGDFTHPAWLAELKENLVPTGDGAYELRPELQAALADTVPGPCRRPVRFVLSGEISNIYKRGGKTRKVHNLVLMPDFEAVERLNARLDAIGNIKSDGRPILGLDSHDLLELCLETDERVIFIPAHIWTPWFSLFGSKSGFDAIEECYGELTGHIHALETGLSSDPPMNWRLSALDRYRLVSHSDAHSPQKLAREADLLDCEPSYPALARALETGEGYVGTLEFYPHEGKYHLDGHRKCGLRLMPEETRAHGGRCPVCGGLITVGVLSRVEDLADRPEGTRPEGAGVFESIIPLPEVLSEVLGKGPATKTVQAALSRILSTMGPELHVLRQAESDELKAGGGELLAEAIARMRSGRVVAEGGYDGVFGVVRIFEPKERERLAGQDAFWKSLAPARRKKAAPKPAPKKARPAPAPPLLTPQEPAGDGLSDEQRLAVEPGPGHLIVRAGPGSGKTRVLVHRAAALVAAGTEPGRVCLATFTRKAAGEMAERLANLAPSAAGVWVGTLHRLGRQVLCDALGREPQLMPDAERASLVAALAREHGLPPARAELGITRLKQGLGDVPPADMAGVWAGYQAALKEAGAHDLDDLVREAALALRADAALAGRWQGRFAHILVDEYQDLNQAQAALLRSLAGGGAAVAAIGDPDQAIYGFRGADPGVFAGFGRDFPGAAELSLTLAFRNSGPILALAGALMNGQGGPGLRAVRPGGPRPVLCELASAGAEAAWVARRVAGLLGGMDSRQVEAGADDGAYAPSEVAVLYRVHAQAGPLAEALAREGVPFQVAADAPLAELDPLDLKARRVTLLSMHAAKGLEWPVVFVTGVEEGLLPYQPPGREPADADEERRLLYVACTRAGERLYISRARQRTLFGQARTPAPSPLLGGPAMALAETERALSGPRRARQMDLFAPPRER